ncbi:MAG: acetylxylan esterase [Terriglobia bacterium]
MLMRKHLCFLAIAVLVLAGAARAQGPSSANYDESKVGTYTLPDPLVFADGKLVRTAADWKTRRVEILRLFSEDMLGRRPQPPQNPHYKVFDEDRHALGGKAIRKQVSIYLSPGDESHKEDLLLYTPAGARKPVAVILSLNFGGNQSVTKDPAVKLPTLWDRKTHDHELATEASRGTDTGLDVEKTLARGYGFATIYYQDIDPDFVGGYEHGIRPLFLKAGQTAPAPDDWGAIGAWAYGLSRALDYLEQDRDVDAKRVAVMGHSRLGKTALWASATDPRFAMAISSCSGEGGASLMRRNYGETIRHLVDVFPYWFCPNFARFAGRADQLPVDAHELIALSAPRPVYVTAAEDDKWADPRGMFLACVAAGPVYRLLGAQDLGTDRMPELNHPILHTLGFHYRTGEHAVTAFDWDQFLAFMDVHLRGR